MKAVVTIFSFVFLSLCYQAKSVSKCYSCEDTCGDPLDVEECPNVDGKEYVCMSYQNKSSETISITRGCVPKTVTQVCQDAGNSCYTCDEDLCNHSVKECHLCRGKCNELTREECPIADGTDYACWAAVTILDETSSITQKGCYAKTDLEECDKLNQLESNFCYTCNEDLCNHNVKKCYTCQGLCNGTLEEEICPTNATDYVCLSSEVTFSDGRTLMEKGCQPNSASQACKEMDAQDLSWCYTCRDDLCNGNNDSNSVKKCYSCRGNCSDPLDLEKCPSRGGNYLCMASKIDSNETRGCLLYSDDVIEACNATGLCYTCNEDLCNNQTYSHDDNNDGDNDNSSAKCSMSFDFFILLLISIIFCRVLSIQLNEDFVLSAS